MDPKRQAWLYLIVGLAAVISATYFLTAVHDQGQFGILDWVILGMGIVAVYRGVKGFIDLRRSGTEGETGKEQKSAPKPPSERRKLPRPGSGER